jgi:predicted RNase H-like HicB family nuclease
MSYMKRLELKIHATWDDEANVWYVQDSDVPGLATEAATLEALLQKLKVMIPELIELNGILNEDTEVPLQLLIQSEQRVAIGC